MNSGKNTWYLAEPHPKKPDTAIATEQGLRNCLPVLLLIRGRFKYLLFFSIDLNYDFACSLFVVGLLLVATACTLLPSYWAFNRKETLTALEDETAVRDFFVSKRVNLAFLPVDLKPAYIRTCRRMHWFFSLSSSSLFLILFFLFFFAHTWCGIHLSTILCCFATVFIPLKTALR